jgi:choline-glycine betaine transporter
MNSTLLGVLIVIVLVVGSTLSIMNKSCKSGYHSWCAPMSTVVRHHVKTRPPA